MKKLFSIFVLALFSHLTMNAGIIGEWTVYPAFGDITEVETAGTHTYVLASGGLFSYNSADQSVTVYDKSKTLSDCDIAHIAWCQAAKRLVIVYSNQNIDLLEANGDVINISDYYSKSMTEDKTINGIDINGKHAYLSTGFGIIQIDVANAYIKNTYDLGFSVNWTHLDDKYIYAESKTAGQYRGLITANLLDKSQWVKSGSYKQSTKSIDQEALEKVKPYIPNGPVTPYFGFTCFQNNILYTIPGPDEKKPRMSYVQMFDGNEWTNISNDISYFTSRRYRNLYFIVPFANEKNHFFAGGETGLYEYANGKVIKEYWFGNSPLQNPYTLDASHTNWSIVPTGALDKAGNLWFFSGIAKTPGIYKLDKEGQITFFEHKEMMASDGYAYYAPASAFIDSRGLLWFTNNYWISAALGRYNPETDDMKTYTSFINEDGTEVPETYIACAAEDKNGNIWFGSNVGVLYLDANDINENNPVFQQVKVPRNDGTNLADYLLANISVKCMAIDGGNRKWFGTENNGVYVVSDDCLTEVHHFTSSNSPLLDNNIEHISIDGTTGEVYISTTKGLCSYTSESTDANTELNSDNIYAYPNPVTPDFTGRITVNGLSYGSYVKIVNMSGILMAEGYSIGGSFQWDGCDSEGKKVASGVYTVLVADQNGKEGAGCKIAIVR